MASKNDSQAHQSEDTSEEKVNKILKTLPELHKLLCSPKEKNPLERRQEEGGITERTPKDTLARSQSAPSALTHDSFEGKLIMKLQSHLEYLKLNLGRLEKFQTNVRLQLDTQFATLQKLITNLGSSRFSSQPKFLIKLDLEGVEKKISHLSYQVPLLSGKSEKQKAKASGDQDDGDEVLQDKAYYYLPGIHTNVEDLTKLHAFRQVKQKFMELAIEQRIYLLSFAVFPENREVHRTVLMYWWIGERILPVKGAEKAVKEILKVLTEKELVEPVEERRKVAPSSYKMTPFVHSSIIHLTKEIGLFDIYHKGKKPSMSNSKMGKVCLVEGSSKQREEGRKDLLSPLDIETVFNVSESYPEFTFKWFSKNPRTLRRFTLSSSEAWFKSLNVFYLGRWERNEKRHIQVQNHELMKCLKHVTKVKLLSLQGISTIRSLNNSVCKLHQLIVLDLRECYELTELPEKIDSLQNLVYLDMTGCYMLEWIPLRLALLKKLEVLKGFVVSDALYESVACKLVYLKNLPKLRKLSIEVNRDDFTVTELTRNLEALEALTSVKVTWRMGLNFSRHRSTARTVNFIERAATRLLPGDIHAASARPVAARALHLPPKLGFQLRKLNLQRFPDEELPAWLEPEELDHLEKLYIGGGKRLKTFGRRIPEKPTKCAVEVLRLTSLPQLTVGWLDLKEIYFPKLTFLEKYECPRVSLTPCDGDGIWRSDQD